MSPQQLDPRMDTSTDFADGARYEAQIREEARTSTGHGELLDFMERLAAAIPWEDDHDLLMLAVFAFAPGITVEEHQRRVNQVCTTGSVHGRHKR